MLELDDEEQAGSFLHLYFMLALHNNFGAALLMRPC
jgi:hypothetical protein